MLSYSVGYTWIAPPSADGGVRPAMAATHLVDHRARLLGHDVPAEELARALVGDELDQA